MGQTSSSSSTSIYNDRVRSSINNSTPNYTFRDTAPVMTATALLFFGTGVGREKSKYRR